MLNIRLLMLRLGVLRPRLPYLVELGERSLDPMGVNVPRVESSLLLSALLILAIASLEGLRPLRVLLPILVLGRRLLVVS